MSSIALIFVLTGSVLHLGWNILTKKSRDQLTFLWLALIGPGLFGAYFLLTKSYTQVSHQYFVATAIIHAIYFYTLAYSYKFADLSFVYPYARGVGTLVATTGGMLILNERPSTIGFVGIFLTLSGTLIEPLFKANTKKQSINLKGIGFTVLTGIMIGAYLVLDTSGIRTVESSYEYVSIMFFYASLLLLPFVITKNKIQQELSYSSYKPFLGCLFMAGAYAIILLAMQSTPVSYTVSARASGIILSAVYGKFVFKESVTPIRILAISFILVGVICLAMA